MSLLELALDATSGTLPTHPRTGLHAVGLRRDGRPIWPILGGAEDDGSDGDAGDDDTSDDNAGTGDGQDDDDAQDDGSDQLGDAGKKALDRMKERAKAERQRRQELERELAQLRGKGGQGDGQDDAEKIREEARREARAEALRDRVLDKIEAKAAGRFADPEDAVALLRGKLDDFIDGDKLDVDAITEELDTLLARKPHLSAQGGRRFQGSGDGGSRGTGRKAQWTEADLAKASPQQIEQARKDGLLNDLLGKQ